VLECRKERRKQHLLYASWQHMAMRCSGTFQCPPGCSTDVPAHTAATVVCVLTFRLGTFNCCSAACRPSVIRLDADRSVHANLSGTCLYYMTLSD
jgi:hypothetical protein